MDFYFTSCNAFFKDMAASKPIRKKTNPIFNPFYTELNLKTLIKFLGCFPLDFKPYHLKSGCFALF